MISGLTLLPHWLGHRCILIQSLPRGPHLKQRYGQNPGLRLRKGLVSRATPGHWGRMEAGTGRQRQRPAHWMEAASMHSHSLSQTVVRGSPGVLLHLDPVGGRPVLQSQSLPWLPGPRLSPVCGGLASWHTHCSPFPLPTYQPPPGPN